MARPHPPPYEEIQNTCVVRPAIHIIAKMDNHMRGDGPILKIGPYRLMNRPEFCEMAVNIANRIDPCRTAHRAA